MDKEIIKALAVTAEITGTEISPAAAKAMTLDLDIYPKESVLKALTRCRRECKHKLTLADIISRLDDGRPGPEEAWAMLPKSEADSAIITDEILIAYGVCMDLIEAGETISARVAFKEKYVTEVQKARDEQKPVRWFPSFGTDRLKRQEAVQSAVAKNRLTFESAVNLLPEITQEKMSLKSLEASKGGAVKADEYIKQLKQIARGK